MQEESRIVCVASTIIVSVQTWYHCSLKVRFRCEKLVNRIE